MSRSKLVAAGAAAALMAAADGAFSQELPPEIVVTATRLPTPASEVASSVTVITAEEIEQKQARTVVDVLNDVPGLNVVQTGGPGEQATIYMRGAGPNEVKVLIDGIDAEDPSMADGSFDFSHLLTNDIERIEVLRGPQSGLYGADAIGGVINIITKAGSGPPKVRASIEGGSFGTFNQSAGISGSAARFSYAFDAAHFHSAETDVTPAFLVAPGRSINADAYDNKTVSTKLGAVLTPDFSLGLVARAIDTTLDFTQDDALGPESQASQATTHQLFTRGTAHLVLFDGRFDQTLGIAYTDYWRRYNDPNPASIALGNDPADYHGDRLKEDWQGNVTLVPGEVLTLGAENQLDRISDSEPVAAEVTNDAGYVQLQSSLRERFFNTVSLRYDSNQQFGGKTTYRVAPALLIPETGTKLKGSVGTGFNPPTLVELFENFPEFGFFANPLLRPETSLGYETGIEQTVLGQRVSFGATWFHNDTHDLINLNAAGTSFTNVGEATTRGVESFVSYKPWQGLTVRADYTRTLADDDILHQELIRRPKNKATLDGTWEATAALTLTATLLYVGPWIDQNRDDTATGLTANGYTLANLAGSYDLGHGLSLFARVNNLFDRRYQDPLGYEHPGLGIFGGIRLALAP